MISVKNNLHVVRASALYDLIVTAGFMTPWTVVLVFEGFATLSSALGLERPVPALDATGMLLANLLGSVVVVWSLWRLMHASRRVGLYDALARGLFAVWQVYAVAHGASFLLLGFTVFEVAFGIAQVWPCRSELARDGR
ncbi:hypothetical protein HNO86_28965 [Pseudomonas sp. C1C7]|uniref:hypothetical protein n=1 Tax=Pseudomonas sp. C1C7 TaxID=2735272 RepID=UPI0015866B13|nr:hypothetical protein [Pseudomonas sp. C1C7]NUT79081.1 hypothetical protein [Pseudomonas sp. C1C7]